MATRRALAPTTGNFNQIPDSESAVCGSPFAADLKRLASSAPKSPLKQNEKNSTVCSLKSPKALSNIRLDQESSPIGAGLLAAKVERTADALRKQRDALEGSYESSPIGSGLLERKLHRAAAAALPKLDIGGQDCSDDEAPWEPEISAAFVDDILASVLDDLCGPEVPGDLAIHSKVARPINLDMYRADAAAAQACNENVKIMPALIDDMPITDGRGGVFELDDGFDAPDGSRYVSDIHNPMGKPQKRVCVCA